MQNILVCRIMNNYSMSARWILDDRSRLITLAETLIIPDITKTEFNYCFIIHCFKENIQKLLCEMQVDFIWRVVDRKLVISNRISLCILDMTVYLCL